jgi:hypothetical protein
VRRSKHLSFEAEELTLISKSLGWRLEFLRESPDLGFDGEIARIEAILSKIGITTIVDPDSGEVQIVRDSRG